MNTAPTPERISRHDWFWRQPQPGLTIDERGRMSAIPGDARGVLWKDGSEAAVFKYELCRRIDRTMPKWKDLPIPCCQSVLAAFRERTSIDAAKLPNVFNKGCQNYSSLIQFNLAASDSLLERIFRDFIAEERKLKKVKPAKVPRKNAISWRWLELWDLNEIDHVPLSRTEHSMKSKAKKMAGKFLSKVRAASKKSFEM